MHEKDLFQDFKEQKLTHFFTKHPFRLGCGSFHRLCKEVNI